MMSIHNPLLDLFIEFNLKLNLSRFFFLSSPLNCWYLLHAHDCMSVFCPLLLTDLSRTYTQDGVCLTESGLCQLQSLSAAASRRRKPKPKLKLKIINQNSVAVLQAPVDPLSEHSRDEDIEDNRGTCCLTQASSFTADCLLQILNSGLLVLANLHFYMDSFPFLLFHT